MLSTHVKAIPLISTNGPQERALSPTSKAGTGTAASLEQVRGTPESPQLLPTTCTRSHIHAEKCTHTPHITESEGDGSGEEWGGGHSSYDWGGVGGFPSACQRPSLFKAFSPPCPWLRMGMEGWSWGWRNGGNSRQVRNSTGPPGVGGGYKRACPSDRRNQCPRREGGRDKDSMCSQPAQGAGQAHAQVTVDALSDLPLCQDT